MEAVYYAARANLRRLLILHPRLPTRPIGSGNRHVKKLGRHMEKTRVRCALR
jgi:hypothetical protein